MSKVELQEELDRVDQELKELNSKRYTLTEKIKKITIDEDLREFQEWNLSKGTCMIWFAKDEHGHYLVESIKITDVDAVNRYIRGIFGRYYIDFDTPVFKVSEDWVSFNSLRTTRDVFNIYIVDEVQLTVLNTHLCQLNLTPGQLRTCEEAFASNAQKRLF